MPARRLVPAFAFLWGFLPAWFNLHGLGYLYLGRLKWALSLVAALWVLLFGLAWTRLVLKPGAIYLGPVVALVLLLGVPVHGALVAHYHPATSRKPYNRWWFYLAWLLVLLVIDGQLFAQRARLMGIASVCVPSTSMAPTLEAGDCFIADTWRYRSHRPQVGEVVIFSLQTDTAPFVKRIVGVPGDHIEIRDGRVIRNGMPLEEPYLHAPLEQPFSPRDYQYVPALGENEYFILGDLRDDSKDSRDWGPIKGASITGRAEYRWLSVADGTVRWERFPSSVLP